MATSKSPHTVNRLQTYILLFRGINVGGENKLPMKDLRTLLEALGFSQVRTYIQSGNVVLESKAPPDQQLQKAIASEFGFEPQLMVLDKPAFETAVAANPFQSDEGKAIHFYFTSQRPKPGLERMAALAAPTEVFELKGNVFYLLAPDGIGRSKLVANLEKCLGVPATGRNLNTVNKLLELANEEK